MIQINLLPQERKGQAQTQMLRALPAKQVAVGLVILIAIGSGWLIFSNQMYSRMLGNLQTEWQGLEPQQDRWEAVRVQTGALRNRDFISNLLKGPEAQWAPRLNVLSDAVVSEVWFTSLDLNRGESESSAGSRVPAGTAAVSQGKPNGGVTLVLKGAALAGRQEELPPVSQFLERLKAHPEFDRWFTGLELQQAQQTQIQGYEVVEFTIVFYPTGA